MKAYPSRRLQLAMLPALALACWLLSQSSQQHFQNTDASGPPVAQAVPAKLAGPLPSPPAQSTAGARDANPPGQVTHLWAAATNTMGEKLKSHQDGRKEAGRTATFASGSVLSLASLRRGDHVLIPLPGGEAASGRVNLVQPDDAGWVRVGGSLEGARSGSFALSRRENELAGTILLPAEETAINVTAQADGTVLMQEVHISAVICFNLPPAPAHAGVAEAAPRMGLAEAPPILSSRASATAVLYLDFDGATVDDNDWNDGNPIVAQPSTLTSAEMTEVWQRVREDFWPFNVDVTTDPSRYSSAPVGKRMRCIISPTCAWYDDCGAGGVAYLNSFDRAGGLFSSTIPCWVFESNFGSAKSVAEAVSHELGHTLGLDHDGRTSPVEEYYRGHGDGAVGWAPIMGVGYYRELTQWSKGEYANADNQQDDIAIIAGSANGFGLVPDDVGNTRGTAEALPVTGNEVFYKGLITQASDVDYFFFEALGLHSISIKARPDVVAPNLDIALELQDSAGNVLAVSNPDTGLRAEIDLEMNPAIFYVKIRGTGRGSVTGTGYSSYGSIGRYTLTGHIFLDGFRGGLDYDTSGLAWSAGGDVTWIGQAAVHHDGVDAAQSGTLDDDKESWIQTTITEPGTLTFWWKVSSESGWDKLEFYMNGILQGSAISGEVDWTQRTVNIGTGTNVLRWRYAKDGSASSGSDCGWVDEAVFIPARPIITQFPADVQVYAGVSATLPVAATGRAPLRYQWFKNGSILAGATNASLAFPEIRFSDAGNYHVIVSNAFGIATSSLAAVSVTLPTRVIPAWEQLYSRSATGSDVAQAVAVASNGNVVVTGNSRASNGSNDYLTICYTGAGVPLWTNRYNGPGNGDDHAASVATDAAGKVFVTGWSWNGANADFATLAYASNGVPLWTNRYNGSVNSYDYGAEVLVDGGGNVHVAGTSSGGNGDYLVIKYSNAGGTLWSRRWNGGSTDFLYAMALGGNGSVFVTGRSYNGANYDYATLKLVGSSGAVAWTNRYNGPGNDDDSALDLEVIDNDGVIVTGSSYGANGTTDFATVAYWTRNVFPPLIVDGLPIWTNRYDGPGHGADDAVALAVDASGQTFVTGPSAGPDGTNDFVTIAYSTTGAGLWTNRFAGIGADVPESVRVNGLGEVFVTGSSVRAGTAADFVTLCYASTGRLHATNYYSGPGSGTDGPLTRQSMAIAPDGIVVVGQSDAGGGNLSYATLKYGAGRAPYLLTQPMNLTNQADTPAFLSVSAIGDAPLEYQWRKESALLTDGASLSGTLTEMLAFSAVTPSDAAGYDVVVTNRFGSATSSVAVLTVLGPLTNGVVSAQFTAGGFALNLQGSPASRWQVMRTLVLPPSWTTIGTVALAGDGRGMFVDTNPPVAQAFYRFVSVEASPP